MRVGCNTYLFREFDLDTAFEQIAWAGYGGAELHMRNLDEEVAKEVQEQERLQEIAEQVTAVSRKHNLPIYAIETSPFHAIVLNALVLAKELDVPIVTTGWSPDPPLSEAIASIRPYAQRAEELGVTLAIKPHEGFAVYSAATVLQLASEVNSKALRINYDPSHIFRAGEDVAAVVSDLEPYLVYSQFRDCESRDNRGPAEAQVAGRGQIDLPSALKALKEVGYEGHLSFLCVGAKDYTLAQRAALAGEHKGYMTRCLEELGVP